jgi:diguanylate cyclase (GGDEF)-like protein
MDDLVRELALREARAVADGFFERSPQVHRPPHVLRLSSAHDELIDLRSLATIDEILERGVTVIHRDLGFERIVVVEREHGNPEAARVRAVACRTRLTGPAPRTLVEVPLTAGGSLLDALDGGRAHASSPGADADVLRFLRTRSFAAAPLRAGTSAVGAILADHFLSGRDVAPDEIAALGIAASALGLVIESAAITAEGKTLRALAEKDALTGINNRRNVLEILRREIDRARRYGKPLSVALIDVDHFKSWNDLHGHQVGDTVLQAVAQIISSTGREIDACGRYGGEEFLVVLPETTAEHAMLYAERLRMTIESHGNDLAATYPNSALTASIGVTQLLTRGDDADRMIQRADRALYAAKDHGRNRVCVEATPRSDPVLPAPVVRGILDDL